jgi:hypothetical protein
MIQRGVHRWKFGVEPLSLQGNITWFFLLFLSSFMMSMPYLAIIQLLQIYHNTTGLEKVTTPMNLRYPILGCMSDGVPN